MDLRTFNPHHGTYHKVWRGQKLVIVWDELPMKVKHAFVKTLSKAHPKDNTNPFTFDPDGDPVHMAEFFYICQMEEPWYPCTAAAPGGKYGQKI